jgi:hypothetical protein
MPGFFDGLMRWDVPEHGVKSPLFFRDLGAIGIVLNGATEAVRPLLPHPGMRPVEMWPGRCLVTVMAVQYRDSDLGPYDELAVAFPVALGDHPLPVFDALRQSFSRTLSAYIWQMPVSTPVACQVGAGIAGFPKTVAELRFARDAGRSTATLLHQGQPAVQLSCDADDAPADRTLTLRSYTVKNGITLQSSLVLHQQRFRDHLRADAARLTLGTGPLADALRALELGERPIASHCCSQARALLFHPRNLRDE